MLFQSFWTAIAFYLEYLDHLYLVSLIILNMDICIYSVCLVLPFFLKKTFSFNRLTVAYIH